MQLLRHPTPVQVYASFGVAAVAAIMPFLHVLGDLYNVWNLQPEYSHGILIPILSAFLIWRQRSQLRKLPFTGSWSGLALIAAGLILRFVGERTTMHTLEHYALLLVIYGLVLALTGPVIFRRLWMPLLILIFAVPLPSFFGNALSLELQLVSSAIGVWLIRVVGISVLLEGNVIDLGRYQLEVAEACSGLRYLFPLLTLAFIVAYLFKGAAWKRVTIVLVSIPITVVMNSLRIALIGATVDRWGLSMLEGTLHEFEGWIFFMLSTGCLVLVAAVLARLGANGKSLRDTFSTSDFDTPAAAPLAKRSNVEQRTAKLELPRPFLAAAALVCAGAVAAFMIPAPQIEYPARVSFNDFPTRIGHWEGNREALTQVYLDALKLDDYVLTTYAASDRLPVSFYAAYYQTQDATRAVHSPHDCIPGGGWEILELRRVPFPGGGNTGSFAMNRAVIQHGGEREIVYYWFQERGRQLTSEYVVRWYLFWDALTRHRTDGGLVRFVSPVRPGANEADVDASMMALAARLVPVIDRYIPN